MIGHKRIPSREGGVEIVVEELSKRLAWRGYIVDAYNRSDYPKSRKKARIKPPRTCHGVRLFNVPTLRNNKLNAILYAFQASVRALFGGYGAIHYHAEGPCITLGIPRFFGIRTVATIHGLDWQRAKWGGFASRMLKHGEKIAALKADEVIVLSQNVKEYFKATYGRDVHFIPNGITKPELRTAEIIKEKYGLEKDGYILFLARLVPEKGLHYLLEAYNRLAPDKKLVIAGSNNHTAEYITDIERIAATNSNIILTGFVAGRELEELLSNAYIFVLPSDIEGMAITLLEAMSYGNCCLVSDIPENTEVVGDKALSFRKGDSADLQEKLTTLLAQPELVEEYRRGVSEYICEKYNWDEVVEQTMRLYGA
jgi:glycosyltransferase involved in cell wall biosynthesis